MFHDVIREMIDTSFSYQVAGLMEGEERLVGRAESEEVVTLLNNVEMFADEKATLLLDVLEQLWSGHCSSQVGLSLMPHGLAEGPALPPSHLRFALCPLLSSQWPCEAVRKKHLCFSTVSASCGLSRRSRGFILCAPVWSLPSCKL